MIVPRRRERPSSCPAPSQATASPSPAPVAAPLPKPPKPIAPAAHDLPLFASLTPINERVAAGPFASRKNPESERHARRQLKRPGALEKTFQEAFAKAHGDVVDAVCLDWTRKQRGQVKAILCEKWFGSAESLHSFVEWYVQDWSQTRVECFGYRTKNPPPALPTLGFLFSQRVNLVNAWNTRAERLWVNSLDDNQRRRYERLRRQCGLSHDAARYEMSKDDAKAEMREENEKERSQAALDKRAGVIARKTAEHVARNAGRIDPRSRTADLIRKGHAYERMAQEPNLNPVSNSQALDDFLSWKPEPFRED